MIVITLAYRLFFFVIANKYIKKLHYFSLNWRLTDRIVEKNAGVSDVLRYNDAADDIRDDIKRRHDLNQILLLVVAQRPPLSVT